MTGLVQVADREIRHHMPYMEGRPRRVAAFVESEGALVHRLGEALDIRALLDEASLLER